MDINLVNNDIKKFIDKYTRFMTKKMYMTSIIYDRFVSNYRYLYDEVDLNIYLYRDSDLYRKMMSITFDKDKLIKLHNKKYLEDMVANYNGDKDIERIMLCDEDKLLVINSNKYIDIILGMFNKYNSDLLVIVDSNDKYNEIRDSLYDIDINIYDIDSLGKKLYNSRYIVIGEYDKYRIISNYIKNILYKDKGRFKEFCRGFWELLYFNKDYLDYDTFRDYHNYMFKRMFLKENTSMDSFNKKMISKRRGYLRSINDELLLSKEEVDIANFLYLNSIEYRYDDKNRCFNIYNGDDSFVIRYINGDSDSAILDDIVLYSHYLDNSSALEHLVYELIKRRYPMERRGEKDIYNRLRDTCEDGYFSRCVSNVIIPLIDSYDEDSDMDNDKKDIIRDMVNYYRGYLEENMMIDRDSMIKMVRKSFDDSYKYVILLEGCDRLLSKYGFDCIIDKCCIINYDYDNKSFISNSVKNIYDYKKYLNNEKKIPIKNVYTGYKEVEDITKRFIDINNESIDGSFDKSKIKYCYYDDSRRLMVGKNKSMLINEIVSNIEGEVLVLGNKYRDRSVIFDNNYFDIYSKDGVRSRNNKRVVIDYSIVGNNINKIYDYIILVSVIRDKYSTYDEYEDMDLKIILYNCMIKCRRDIFIMCPNSVDNDMDS